MIKFIARLVLLTFSVGCLAMPAPVHAAAATGTIKVFSEVKGIELFVDEVSKGTDAIEIKGLEPGQHYVKAVKGGVVIYSELITVTANVTSAILIKSSGQVQEKILESLNKEQQQYKQGKIDILLSKSYQTVGSSYTSSSYYPGYYSIFGSGWTSSSSTQYETTDWKIIQGGVQEISDAQFAQLVGDKDTQERMAKDWEDYNNTTNIGAIIALVGVVMVLVGGMGLFATDTAAAETGAIIFAVGIVPTIIGLGMLSKNPPSGQYVSPGTAAKQAYEYNQALKKKLGLPETYEPK